MQSGFSEEAKTDRLRTLSPPPRPPCQDYRPCHRYLLSVSSCLTEYTVDHVHVLFQGTKQLKSQGSLL